MSTSKYAVGAQAAGLITFRTKITDASTYGPTVHKINIPAGMINISGADNGKGYVIPAQTFQFLPILSNTAYVVYATIPADASTGIVTIGFSQFTSYIGVGTKITDGDTAARRAIAYLRCANGILIPSSIRTLSSFNPNEYFDYLSKAGFFLDKFDPNFTYRGQYWDEEVTFDSAVGQWDVVYKATGGNYFQALADGSLKEAVVGLADIQRGGVSYANFVIISGIITVGTSKLNNTDFPAGTSVYLSGTIPGKLVKAYDPWIANNPYNLGDKISASGYIWQANNSGQSNNTATPFGAGPYTVGVSTVNDPGTPAITWNCIAFDALPFGSLRRVRIGLSLGNGILLVKSGAEETIDNHDASAYAHPLLQQALNNAGIYVISTSQGATTFLYRGQAFDQNAVFNGVVDGALSLVYKNNSTNKYELALAGDATKENVIGMSYGVAGGVGSVISSGFIAYNTLGMTAGQRLYLSSVSPGIITTTQTNIRIGIVVNVGPQVASPIWQAGNPANPPTNGIILLQMPTDELLVHNSSAIAHDNFQQEMKKFGMFIPGSNYPFTYVGQSIDEQATFSSVNNFDIVYYNGTNYVQAKADGSAAQKAMGIALTISGVVATAGFITVGTSILPNVTYPAGTDVYLSDTIAGGYSVTATRTKIGVSLGNGRLLIAPFFNAQGTGDITNEDLTYQSILTSQHYLESYYDIFDVSGTVTSIGTATYNSTDTSYSVVAGTVMQQTVTWISGTYNRFFIHFETNFGTNEAAACLLQFNDPVNGWTTITKDTEFINSNLVSSIQFRITIQPTYSGKIFSWGIFYNAFQLPLPLSSLYQKTILSAPVTQNSNITLPNSANYIVASGLSLKVFRNGLLQNYGTVAGTGVDYNEIDTHTIKVLTSGGWNTNDVIVFLEYYTQIDVSTSNTTRLNLEHDQTGRHVLLDKVTGYAYYIQIQNGDIVAVPVIT